MTSVTAISLSNASLRDLPEAIDRPRYDRARLTPGIVHIGVGNFHRAHQAWYLHRLLQQGAAQDWAIVGAGVRPADAAMREKLQKQDYLTTLIELDPASTGVEVTGAMVDFLPVEPGHAALIRYMARPEIRIVSLTVTEGGYYLDAHGGFDSAHPDIVADRHAPESPTTAFGAIVAALRLRRDAGLAPFTLLSCDNLQGNGHVLRQSVLGVAGLLDPALADWIKTHVSFPNSMVDCIVPATGAAELVAAQETGVADLAPVTHESFRQWVIEDHFCNGRPDWDKVGATFSDQVHAFETMKLRILNGGHQLLANAGELLSIDTISACMEDRLISDFFCKVQTAEILPHVAPVPGSTAADYLDLITHRFRNPRIVDQTRRVAFDGTSRHPGFLHPSIRDALAQGRSVQGLALAEALWARMCFGTREDGSAIDANDPHWRDLTAIAARARHEPAKWLQNATLYGDLGEAPPFVAAFEHWLSMIWEDGTIRALQTYIEPG